MLVDASEAAELPATSDEVANCLSPARARCKVLLANDEHEQLHVLASVMIVLVAAASSDRAVGNNMASVRS